MGSQGTGRPGRSEAREAKVNGLRARLIRFVYRHSWDSRCRNRIPAASLRRFVESLDVRSCVLDVGSADLGIRHFLPECTVIGLDRYSLSPFRPFVVGDITSLPFPDKSIPLVSCIDVLEHLPADRRPGAVAELLRITEAAFVLAFPHSETARRCDETYASTLTKRGKPHPSWVTEHQSHPYPETEQVRDLILSAARKRGCGVEITVHYAEPARVSSLIRAAAASAPLVFLVANLLLGLLLPFMKAPDRDAAYRAVLLVAVIRA